MLISKVIFVLSFVFIFSSCEDTPQGVGVYKASAKTVNQKHDVMDGSKLRLSIFNTGKFGDPDIESKSEAGKRARTIIDSLGNTIFSKSDMSIFLDVIDLEVFKSTIGKGATCSIAENDYKNNLHRYIVICRNRNFKITSKSKSLERLNFELNSEESVQAYGASYKYEHVDKNKSKEDNKKLDYEFYLVALDYSDVIAADSREVFSERIADEVSEKSKGLPVVVVGDWRNDTEENEMETHFKKFNLEFSNLDIIQAKNNTVINTDKSNPVDKKYNNLLFNLETWREGPVKYLGACGKLSGQVRYQKTIGNDCPTIFTLERKL